jgi:predicted Fe-S protein YdhL (DUF1289 family)
MLSPCRKICVYDSLRDLCAGCGRRLEEIENWLEMSEEERAAIIAQLPERLKPMPPPAS